LVWRMRQTGALGREPRLRPTCTDCAIKHLAQASITLQEARHGYPSHIFYSRGHMAEAEAELAKLYPVHSDIVRRERKLLEQNPEYTPDFMALMEKIDDECEVCALSGNPRSAEGATPYAWSSCEARNPLIQERILACVTRQDNQVTAFATCRGLIRCPG